jgi:DNA-binding helix-hairpin-helix protein with protein kinase domain
VEVSRVNQILKPGSTIRAASSGLTCTVTRFLGGGGQGEVYRMEADGKPLALKWYFPQAATAAQRSALETLVQMGPPDARFLWPIDLASAAEAGGFGYIMRLREPRYRGIVDMMKRRIEPTFRALATAGLELSDSYLRLHARGLCYRDISFGNVFFDPDSGEALICDNDNVAVDGGDHAGVLGTPRFMAPEVVRGDAAPSTQTDLFSLAVLLFYMLMVHHPLEGKREISIRCLDLPAMTRLYGTAPVFIFDPADDSNRPVRGYHDNALDFWPIYPGFVQDLFTRAFTEGIRDPQNARVRESEWRAAMVRLRDCIVNCPSCGAENFATVTPTAGAPAEPPTCWGKGCGRQVPLPAHVRMGRQIVMLNRDTRLFPHHVDDGRMYDFSQPVAVVTQHPTEPNVWGLKNVSTDPWTCRTSTGTVSDVKPGRSVRLAVGTTINFGRSEGEIG